MLDWMKHKLESRLLAEISIPSDRQMTPHLLAENEELKSLLIKLKEESEKVNLKVNTQKTKITASGPTTSWQIDGETVEEFILGELQNHCSHEIKRHSLLGRKDISNLNSILQSRDINFANKSPSNKRCVFPNNHVWIWELNYIESWVPNNWRFLTVVFGKDSSVS